MTDQPASIETAAIFADAVENCPALQALIPKRQLFVLNFVFDVDSPNNAEAARRAGYGNGASTAETMAKTARNLLVDASVQAAILEVGRRYLSSLVGKALRTCDEIMSSKTARDQDRLRAAQAVLDRTLPAQTSVNMQVDHFHHDVDHGKAAVEALRYLKKLQVPRAVLVEQFGHSGLARYEAQLAAEDEAAAGAAKLIEGRNEAA
jgi:phage terminase small subunit